MITKGNDGVKIARRCSGAFIEYWGIELLSMTIEEHKKMYLVSNAEKA